MTRGASEQRDRARRTSSGAIPYADRAGLLSRSTDIGVAQKDGRLSGV